MLRLVSRVWRTLTVKQHRPDITLVVEKGVKHQSNKQSRQKIMKQKRKVTKKKYKLEEKNEYVGI